MDRYARRLQTLASGAEMAQRSLERAIADVDSRWRDGARRSFDADHLEAIRSDARYLRSELEEIARLAASTLRAGQ